MPTHHSRLSTPHGFSRSRATHVGFFTGAILSIATISWALLSWTGDTPVLAKALLSLAACFTLLLAACNAHYIQENSLALYQDDARVAYSVALVAIVLTVPLTIAATIYANAVESSWRVLDPKLGLPSFFYLPGGLGLLLIIYFFYQFSKLYELPDRRLDDSGGEFPTLYRLAIVLAGLIAVIAIFSVGLLFNLSAWEQDGFLALAALGGILVVVSLNRLVERSRLRPIRRMAPVRPKFIAQPPTTSTQPARAARADAELTARQVVKS